MKVAALQQFLRSLQPALEAAGSQSAAAQVVDAAKALDAFQSLAVAEFAAFLVRAKDYHASGAVRVPEANEQQIEQLSKLLAQLSEAAKDPSQGRLEDAQHEVAAAIQSLATDSGLKGKLSPDAKWVDAKIARARVAPHVQRIRELAARIISPEVYSDPHIREEKASQESALDRDSLIAVAAEFGIKATAKSQPGKVIGDVLARLSGHRPATKSKSKPASFDPVVVQEHTKRLADLIARSIDPEALSETELDTELGRLKALPKATLVEVVSRAGIEGVRSGDSVSAVLQRVRLRLNAARRARERAEV